ncbi:hypothetical protein [Vibrio sp. D431a]|uniref:hypothetical protein n=1 Tax=Vibrio sp. D431a TaxID=2837388 RepID=UPI0025550FE5|nr:hypothetical protein [Vibrio sp. D431a]MDK9793892.1 hypothetical protein [Vibrio sp. D431a]
MFRLIQSDYTSLGMTKISDAIKNSKEMGLVPVLADKLSLNGLAEFAIECKRHNIEGFAGLRVPFETNLGVRHLTLIAKSEIGLSNLASIVETASQNGSLKTSDLKGKTVDLACLIDHDSPLVEPNDDGTYKDVFVNLKKLFQTNDIHFSVYQYNESHMNEYPSLKSHNDLINGWLENGKKDSLKTHCLPICYSSFENGVAGHQALVGRYLALNSVSKPSIGRAVSELPKWMDFSQSRQPTNLTHQFLTSSTQAFLDKCSSGYLQTILREEEVVDLGSNINLRDLMYKELEGLFSRKVVNNKQEYINRLEEELKVVEREGFENYFLALIQYSMYCKTNGVPTKVRGSSANSIICYLGGLSSKECDPLAHKLDFRRFMGARIETPDIDIDVASEKRGSIYDFLNQHVSENSVGALIVQGKQNKLHTLFLQAREVLLYRYGEGVEYSFQIPKVGINDSGIIKDLKRDLGDYSSNVLSDLVKESPVLKEYMDKSGYIKELVAIGMELDGLRGNATPHPSAIVVNNHSIRPTPFVKTKDGSLAMVPHEFAKSVGLLKYDILSSKVIQGLDLAKNRLRSTFSENVEKCFVADGDGIYQFIKSNPTGLNQMSDKDSSLRCLKDINPTNFSELAAFSALIRPGVSDRKDYLRNSPNKAFDDQEIAEFLSETRGFVIYEDQILQMSIDIAGMNPSDADALRTGLKKGDQRLIDSQKDAFVNGLISKGRKESCALKVWARLCKYKNEYLFNKGHATEYAITTVEQALIKRDYPHVYLDTIVYSHDQDKGAKDRIQPKYIKELVSRGITFAKPNINQVHSYKSGFATDGSGKIYPSLRFYGFSDKMLNSLTETKRFGELTGLDDFIQKTFSSYLNVTSHSLLTVSNFDVKSFRDEMSVLIKHGFFDFVGVSESLSLEGLNVYERRSLLLQASDQLIDFMLDPFPSEPTPSISFVGELSFDKAEYIELLKETYGDGYRQLLVGGNIESNKIQTKQKLN